MNETAFKPRNHVGFQRLSRVVGAEMGWFVLADGVPEEPSYDEMLACRDQPQPHSFLKRLFRELGGITLTAGRELVREKLSHVENARGYCGRRDMGYAWDSSMPVGDTSLPLDEKYVTYGLPGATLIWSVAYRKRGQLGYATWTDRGLSAGMSGHVPEIVERVWTEIFGLAPVFVPVPPQDEQRYEDIAGQREEQLRTDLQTRK